MPARRHGELRRLAWLAAVATFFALFGSPCRAAAAAKKGSAADAAGGIRLKSQPSAASRGPVALAAHVAPAGSQAAKAAWPARNQAPQVGGQAGQGSPAALEGLDAEINQELKDWKAPGLGLAVVRDGRIILVKGYGWRNVKQRLPVTPQTLFALGSISKSFTVTLLGTLVDSGQIGWDKPVRDYLPGFRLYDPYASDHLTVRDMITHRSGLPRHDMVWYSSDFSRADLVCRLRFLQPNKELRQAFQYNNLMFMTAGYMAGELLHATWEDAVRQRILAPLDMGHTNFSVEDSQKSPDFSLPYEKDDQEEVKPIAFHGVDSIAPAGAVNSCASDMARYLLFQMNQGEIDGRHVLSANSAQQMQSPQMVIQGERTFKELGPNSYGMGFYISTYRGHKMVAHGGNIDGFSAELAFLPDDHTGVVVVTNLDETPLPNVVAYNVFDRLLGLERLDWSARYLHIDQQQRQSEKAAKARGYAASVPGTHPSHGLQDYVGEYENPGYGRVSIQRAAQGEKAVFAMRLNKLRSPLQHFHYDVFVVPDNALDPLEKTKVTFQTGAEGDIDSLTMPLEPRVPEIVFTRLAPAEMRETSFLRPLTGKYQLPGAVLTVSLQGDHTLVASKPGEPVIVLVPRRGLRFDMLGRTQYSIEFKKDAAGKVTGAVINEAGRVSLAAREE
jgi:CubicO group peptidase (beta-lactamase class C family)